jgi:Rrf2 family protein
MLSKTSELGIQILIYLALKSEGEPIAPRQIAEHLGASPTYLSKIAGTLAKAGILRAVRGAKGGVVLARKPEQITLFEIVEACQGKILGDYCELFDDLTLVCGFHEAMHHLHHAILDVLNRWTLQDLVKRPRPNENIQEKVKCKMAWCSTLLDSR